MDSLPVGRIEQLSYNDKLKADIAQLMAAQDGVSEKRRLQAEVVRLRTENAALTAWAQRAYEKLTYIVTITPNAEIAGMLEIGISAEQIYALLADAPGGAKGGE